MMLSLLLWLLALVSAPTSSASAFVPSLDTARGNARSSQTIAVRPAATTVDTSDSSKSSMDRIDVVWMGAGDLRIDDHGGLEEAMKDEEPNRAAVVPILVLEGLEKIPGTVAHTLDTAAVVSNAIQDLQFNLATLNLHLHVFETYSDAWKSLSNIKEAEIHVHVCDLGPVDNRMGYGALVGAQSAASPDNKVQWHPWTCRLREEPWEELDILSNKYPDYTKAYSKDPSLPLGPIPANDPDNVFLLDAAFTVDIPSAEQLANKWQGLLNLNPDQMQEEQNTGLYGTHWGGLDASTATESSVMEMLRVYVEECREEDQLFAEHPKAPVATRNPRSLEHATVSWMLRGKDSTKKNTQNMICGEAMTRFLAMPMLLGTVSPRRVWHMAQKDDMFHTTPLGTMAETSEWHKILAAKSIAESSLKDNKMEYDYWRWHGFLCRYGRKTLKEGTSPSKEGVLLVHGFGASGSQWEKAMEELCRGTSEKITTGTIEGLAPDLIGFGQSEKPPLTYTQYLWESYTSSFVKEVALHKQKWDSYVVGGNSIGGYTSMGTAADDTVERKSSFVSGSGAPGTGRCAGVVLMNSAGQINSREEIESLRQDKKIKEIRTIADVTSHDGLSPCSPISRPAARLFGNGLLTYLRPRIQSICKNLYPTNPDAVDDNLCGGILRDSLDPGAVNVMISGSKLPPPRTANELLGADFGSAISEGSDAPREGMWQGPVLVAQGMKDPLNDAKTRAKMLGDLRDNIVVKAIDAGHCPHDELPGDVAFEIVRWLEETRELRNSAARGTQTQVSLA